MMSIEDILNDALKDDTKAKELLEEVPMSDGAFIFFMTNDRSEILRYIVEDRGYIPKSEKVLKEMYYASFADRMKYIKLVADELPRISNTFLVAVVEDGNLDVVKIIVHRVGNTDAAIRAAAYSGYLDIFEFFVDELHVKLTKSLFQHAVKSGNIELVKFFLKEELFKATYDTMLDVLDSGNVDMLTFVFDNNVYKANDAILWSSLDYIYPDITRIIVEHMKTPPIRILLDDLGDNMLSKPDLLYLISRFNYVPRTGFPIDFVGYCIETHSDDLMEALLDRASHVHYHRIVDDLKDILPATNICARPLFEKIKNKKPFARNLMPYVKELRTKWG
jgi:hypothetical protein